MSFIGNSPVNQAFTPAVDFFSGNSSTTAFTLSRPVASVAQIVVAIENVIQNPGTAYTVSGNTITFTSAPPTNSNNIWVNYTSPITQVMQPGQGTVGQQQMVNPTGTGNPVLQNSPTLMSPIITGSTPQTTVYTSGSGTYTVPTGARYLQIMMVGAGAGGQGSGTSQGSQPTAGGSSIFGSNTAFGGTPSSAYNGTGGSGGTATLSGAIGFTIQGGMGGPSIYNAASGSWGVGGQGGSSALGGAGAGGSSGGGGNSAMANTGGGGGGGATSGFNGNSGPGGGAGGYINAVITSLSATYSYYVGTGGTAGGAGGSGNVGGAGGSGVIMVTAFF